MTIVVTLEDYKPSPRYDGEPWTDARIEEALVAAGPWTTLETQALTPVDADPENPAYRNFTTDLGTAEDLWYRIVFLDADASTGLPTIPVQNVEDDRPVYAASSELARILKIRTPTPEQETALERVLAAASGEINAEIDLASDDALAGWELALAGQVALERGAELWKLQEVQFGVITGGEFGPIHMARNTWDKHAYTLAPLKGQWGIG